MSEPYNLDSCTSAIATTGTGTVVSASEITIPQLIHFIWAGGQARISSKNMRTVIRWTLANPDWNTNIWVDELTDPDVINSNYYQTMILRLLDDPEFSDTDPGIKETLLDRIHVYDISNNPTRINFRNEYVAYELDKLVPNYGASSDLLRLIILEIYGGAYFDFDVYPGTTKLSEIQLRSLPKHRLYVDYYSQRATFPVDDQLDHQLPDWAGNDTLICTINNPLIRRALLTAYGNYNKDNPIECAYKGNDFSETTMYRTGALLISLLLQESKVVQGYGRLYRLLDKVEIHQTRDGCTLFLSQPADINAAEWIRMFAINTTHDLALIAIKKSITFELNHFGIIRIDDHINDLIISCNSSYQNSILVIKQILEFCQPYLNSMRIVQVTGRFPEVVDFCQQHICRTLFKLDRDDLEWALIYMLRPNYLYKAVDKRGIQHSPQLLEGFVRFLNDRLNIIAGILSTSTEFMSVPLDTIRADLDRFLCDYRSFVKRLKKETSKIEGLVSLKTIINEHLEQLDTLQEESKKGKEYKHDAPKASSQAKETNYSPSHWQPAGNNSSNNSSVSSVSADDITSSARATHQN